MVAGYCNDVLAYNPSKRVLHEGGYEAYRSIIHWLNPLHPEKFADSLEERIIGRVHKMWKAEGREPYSWHAFASFSSRSQLRDGCG